MSRTLIVVDMQNDFIDGALPVPGAREIIPTINDLIREVENVIFTCDWHPEDHMSFIENGGQWPSHCVKDSRGAQLVDGLVRPPYCGMVYKGQYPDKEEYSGYVPALKGLLSDTEKVYIVGLALDYCVKATALDAQKAGHKVVVVMDSVRGVDPETSKKAIEELHRGKVETI